MKIIIAILFALSTVSATGRSGRVRPDPAEFSLLDALQYGCTDLLPGLKYLDYFTDHFGDYKIGLQLICTVFQEAGGPSEFDAKVFCILVGDYLKLGGLDLLYYHGIGSESMLDRLAIFSFRILSNTTRNLYGIDLSNLTTICPNAYRLFQPPLQKLLEESKKECKTELTDALIREIQSFCHDWKSYFARLGVPDDSPYQQVLGGLVDIVPELVGLRSYANMCNKLKPLFGRDYAGGRWYVNEFVTLTKDEL